MGLVSRGRESCVVIRGHRSRVVGQSFPPTEVLAILYVWHGTHPFGIGPKIIPQSSLKAIIVPESCNGCRNNNNIITRVKVSTLKPWWHGTEGGRRIRKERFFYTQLKQAGCRSFGLYDEFNVCKRCACIIDDLWRNWNDGLAVAALKVYAFMALAPQVITPKRSNNNNNINNGAAVGRVNGNYTSQCIFDF